MVVAIEQCWSVSRGNLVICDLPSLFSNALVDTLGWSVILVSLGRGPIFMTQRLLLIDLQLPHGVNNIAPALLMLA